MALNCGKLFILASITLVSGAQEASDENCALQKSLNEEKGHLEGATGGASWDSGVPLGHYGKWTVIRQHVNQWRTKTRTDTFCGERTDQFEVRDMSSEYCFQNQDQTLGQTLVSRITNKKKGYAWFCAKQGPTTIEKTSFVEDTACVPDEGHFGLWTITRECKETGKVKQDKFCGMDTDTFDIAAQPSGFCAENQSTANGWSIVNQNGGQEAWAWYCENQCKPEIDKKYSGFEIDPNCENSEEVGDPDLLVQPVETLEEATTTTQAPAEVSEWSCPHAGPNPGFDTTRGICTNEANPWQQARGITCAAKWLLRKRCTQPGNTELGYWKKCQFCAQSCADAGLGYDGLNCSS